MESMTSPVTPLRVPSKRGLRYKSTFTAYLYLAPALIFLLIFTLFPMVRAIVSSFYTTNPVTNAPNYIGFGNYHSIFNDPIVTQVFRNTLIFVVGTVPISIIVAMILAVLVNRQYKLNPFFRFAIFHPVVLPMVSAASIWLFMYTPEYGVVDQALSSLGGSQTNWLGQPGTALIAIMFMTVWKQIGLFMVFFLAGLQNIGQDPYEAAAVDGASGFRLFRSITVPLLMPTTLFVSTFAIVNGFQMVDQLYVMTQGGPNNGTNMLLYDIYQQAFTYSNTGKASALSVILIAVLLFFAILQTVVDRKVHYQ